jgi:hypothetical protein
MLDNYITFSIFNNRRELSRFVSTGNIITRTMNENGVSRKVKEGKIEARQW